MPSTPPACWFHNSTGNNATPYTAARPRWRRQRTYVSATTWPASVINSALHFKLSLKRHRQDVAPQTLSHSSTYANSQYNNVSITETRNQRHFCNLLIVNKPYFNRRYSPSLRYLCMSTAAPLSIAHLYARAFDEPRCRAFSACAYVTAQLSNAHMATIQMSRYPKIDPLSQCLTRACSVQNARLFKLVKLPEGTFLNDTVNIG
jgi:hypothetical protein